MLEGFAGRGGQGAIAAWMVGTKSVMGGCEITMHGEAGEVDGMKGSGNEEGKTTMGYRCGLSSMVLRNVRSMSSTSKADLPGSG